MGRSRNVARAATAVVNKDDYLFLRRWLRAPLRVASVTPSGFALSQGMASQVDWSRPGVVVELGGGTGTVTRALIAAGGQPGRLVVVERDPEFCRLLRTRFPDVRVLSGDATRIADLMRRAGIEGLNAVVSGLPLLSMRRDAQKAILGQTFEIGGDDALFVQFTYGIGAPVPVRRLRRWGLSGCRAVFTLLNVPPASVWRITKVRRLAAVAA